jgi:hypothetical protein
VRTYFTLLASIALASGLASPAWALPKPMTLSPAFDNAVPTEVKLPKGSAACPVRIVALEDVRRSPEMIGVHQRRPIFAPDERAAWLKSIVTALNTRGIAVSFDNQFAAPDATTVKVDLTTAWITDTKVNISASAVFRMQVTSAKGDVFDRFYRGGNSRMTYWSAGASVLQQAIDVALARSLDAMARDLLTTCQPATA